MTIKTFHQWQLTEADDAPEQNPTPDVAPEPMKTITPPPPGATDDDGRVPADTPEGQSVVVIHPDVRLRFKMTARADQLQARHKFQLGQRQSMPNQRD